MKKNLMKIALLLCGIAIPFVPAQAQSDRVHIGIIGGLHQNNASYSDLNENLFGSPKGLSGLGGGVFMEFELGDSRMLSLRPELMFLSRGHKLEDIPVTVTSSTGTSLGDDVVEYKYNPQFIDFRMPIIVNFGQPGGVRPYLYLAPVVGFPSGGKINVEGVKTTSDGKLTDKEVDISKANIASTYFAGQLGLGVKIPVGKANLGIEANYELGLTDTYASKEKDGKATAADGLFYGRSYNITGDRKFKGFEVMATLSFPLSAFKSSPKPAVVKETPVVVRQQPVRQPVKVVEKPCYTLEEITSLANQGKSVAGKTICAMEQINFENNKSTISPRSYAYLNKIVAFMNSTKNKVEVKGHTDSRGSAEYNMKLSKARAEAVYNYLIQKGVNPKRLSYSYYGLTRPIATNDTEAGRRQNRRVEFEIK